MLEALRSEKGLWDLFVKKEEYESSSLDEHGRFLYRSSMHKDVTSPSVSQFLVRGGLRAEYPDGRKFGVCLTHDIDLINPHFTVSLLKRGGISRAAIKWFDKNVNPRCNFGYTMDLEEAHGAKSTFFFLALQPGGKDFNYYIEDMKNEIRSIVQSGCEVGLHGGYGVLRDIPELVREKRAIEAVAGSSIVGYRNHYMQFNVPDSWGVLEEAGFKYDSTLGYPDNIGFRNGMCHPFRPYDARKGKTLDILEIPLTVMDGTLFTYMGMDSKTALAQTKKLIDSTADLNGVITILWHNTHIMRRKTREVYKAILEYCEAKGAWMTSGAEVLNWWSKNDFLKQG